MPIRAKLVQKVGTVKGYPMQATSGTCIGLSIYGVHAENP